MYYEFECKKCGIFTIKKPMSEASFDDIEKCPCCGEESTRKISGYNFHMKSPNQIVDNARGYRSG